jgi:hypothetical protein
MKTLFLLASTIVCAGIANAAIANSADWATRIAAARCDSATPGMRVLYLGRRFQIPVDFEFRGLDQGMARFTRGDASSKDFSLLYFGKGREAERGDEFSYENVRVRVREIESSPSGTRKGFSAYLASGDQFVVLTTVNPDLITSFIGCSSQVEP